MTDRNLSIKVALGAVNNLTQPFNAAQKSTAALGRQIKATRDNLRDLPKQAASFDKLAESSNKAAARIEKLRRASDAVKSLDNPTQKQIAAVQKWDSRLGKLQEKQTAEVRRLAELRASLYQHGVSVASNSTATEQITQRTAQYNRQLQLQEQRLKRVAAARASYDRGQELRGKLQSGGMTALATGAVMAAPVALALKSYTGMEDAMKGVAKQVNGLRDDNGQRTAQFYEMQNAIKDAAELAPLPGGAADFAALVEGGARMGVATEGADWAQQKKELLDFANVSAKASKAFELPAGELAESLGKISGLYKIPTKDIEQLGDALNYLDDNAQSKGADIIDVLQRMGGVADRLNYKQAAALGSTFLSLGAQSEIAASAANAMVRELSIATMQSDKFLAGLDALGMDEKKIEKAMSVDAMGTIREVLGAVKKLPDVDRLRVLTQLFGKDFGKDAAKLVNNIDELDRQLALTSSAGAKGSMQKESDIDKDSISAQLQLLKSGGGNALSSMGETLRAPMLEVVETLKNMIGGVRRWVEANPKLAGTIMKVVATLSIATITLGGLALAAAALLGPMLALRLGFSLLAGNGGLSIMLARLGNMLKWVATSPLRLLGSIGGTVFGALGSAVGLVLSPVGLLVAAIIGAGVLIYQYWQPIQAFFSGFFTGLMAGLQPVKAAFVPLAPIFDAIGSAIGRVWNWFTQLLSPVESSKASLEAATNAGKTFGEVVGAVISGLFWPVEQLAKGLGWLLEKLGAIPKAADAASGAVAAMNRPKAPVMYEWDPVLKKMVAAKSAWSWSPDKPVAGNSSAMANAAASPIASGPTAAPSIYGAVDRSKKKKGSGDSLASSSPATTATDNTREKLGDIVFKNVPDYLPLASPYLSAPTKAAAQPGLLARMQQSASDMLARTRDMIAPGNDFDALSLAGDIPQLARKPLSAQRNSGPISYEGDRYDITIKLEGGQAASIDENKLVNMLYDKIATLQRQKESRRRSTFTDREQ
ncbi:TPA: phage tail tape measure protein [Yersinia enterocolitica]|uniref:phage tail tape measure protein n=1 Tax=Yersinia enterocolitica TaxID=630 RepID=UPI00281355F1|nr:phage tail tape measure protein [Yersinia enterocolitica]EKN6093922.1 phage tail tape measure protein [Yersinia enterocolitica]ELI8043429.1 phage tail tape measure protein [Yersinia enterocolitica]ELI8441077.1 phage tail tape measure protein [Yersinia enterocolitica]ELW8974528.1 phage tail tape measure protein [Yersinia enterocolitica]